MKKKEVTIKFNKEDIEKISGVYPDLIQISEMPQKQYQVVQKMAELKNLEGGIINIELELKRTKPKSKYTPQGSQVKRLIKLKNEWKKDIRKLKHEINKLGGYVE